MQMPRRSLIATAFVALCLAIGTIAAAHDDNDTADFGDSPEFAFRAPLPPATMLQLAAARRATRKFFDVEEARRAGYADIGVFVPHMGHHFLKATALDEKFDPEEPELLVYSQNPCSGKLELVAVEYAVPLALSAKAPKGFIGNADHWDVNSQFSLWTLHAWVWEHNPDGVFADLNPRVP